VNPVVPFSVLGTFFGTHWNLIVVWFVIRGKAPAVLAGMLSPRVWGGGQARRATESFR